MEPQLAHFLAARETLARRIAAARFSRLGRHMAAPGEDDEELATLEHGARDAPPLLFHLIYRDSKGQMSSRAITTRRLVEEPADVRVFAFCHFRRGVKSFLATRMVEVLDLATGEVSEDGHAYFRAHPLLRNEDGGPRHTPETRAVRASRHELAILTFLSAADGELHEDELDAMVLHVCNRSDDDLDQEAVRQAVRGFTPDERAFWRSLDCLAKGEGDARALARSMRRVAEADGKLTMEEIAFVGAVQERLRSTGLL